MKKALCTALAVLMAITLIPGCNKDNGASGENFRTIRRNGRSVTPAKGATKI